MKSSFILSLFAVLGIATSADAAVRVCKKKKDCPEQRILIIECQQPGKGNNPMSKIISCQTGRLVEVANEAALQAVPLVVTPRSNDFIPFDQFRVMTTAEHPEAEQKNEKETKKSSVSSNQLGGAVIGAASNATKGIVKGVKGLAKRVGNDDIDMTNYVVVTDEGRIYLGEDAPYLYELGTPDKLIEDISANRYEHLIAAARKLKSKPVAMAAPKKKAPAKTPAKKAPAKKN